MYLCLHETSSSSLAYLRSLLRTRKQLHCQRLTGSIPGPLFHSAMLIRVGNIPTKAAGMATQVLLRIHTRANLSRQEKCLILYAWLA